MNSGQIFGDREYPLFKGFTVLSFREIVLNNKKLSMLCMLEQDFLANLGILSMNFEMRNSINYDNITDKLAATQARKIKC